MTLPYRTTETLRELEKHHPSCNCYSHNPSIHSPESEERKLAEGRTREKTLCQLDALEVIDRETFERLEGLNGKRGCE